MQKGVGRAAAGPQRLTDAVQHAAITARTGGAISAVVAQRQDIAAIAAGAVRAAATGGRTIAVADAVDIAEAPHRAGVAVDRVVPAVDDRQAVIQGGTGIELAKQARQPVARQAQLVLQLLLLVQAGERLAAQTQALPGSGRDQQAERERQ